MPDRLSLLLIPALVALLAAWREIRSLRFEVRIAKNLGRALLDSYMLDHPPAQHGQRHA